MWKRWLVLIAVAGLGLFLARFVRLTPSQPTPEPAPLSDFTLTERGGQPLSNRYLIGKVWLAGFIFTRCSGPCPHVTATMARLQDELKDVDDFRLVTFTVDPVHDDVDTLKRYATHFSADPTRWLFLTGTEATIQNVLREGFTVHRIKTGDKDVGKSIDHSTKLILVDKQGRVRDLFDGWGGEFEKEAPGTFEENLTRLKKAVRELSKE